MVKRLDLPTFESETGRAEGEPTPITAGKERASGSSSGGDGGGSASGGESDATPPFIMSEALPVIPGKLVKRILKGDFVDMAELLKDNAEMERRRLRAGESSHGQRQSRREIPDFNSWLHCFSLYAAVVGSKYPQKCKDLWAYQAMMIAEHRKCGGRGWLLYDSAFRQQIVSLEEAKFATINQSLYATTFLAYGSRGQFCTRCMMSDHSQEDCAMHPNRALPMVQFREAMSGSGSRREERESPARKKARRGACYAWNDGKCVGPHCRFEHVCSQCGGDHRRPNCSRAASKETSRALEGKGARP